MDRRARWFIAVALGVTGACGPTGGDRSAGSPRAARESSGASTTIVVTSTTVAGPPVAADTPAGLAVQITEAERAIREPSTPVARLARAGHSQQVVYGRLSVREEWQAEVLALVPPDIQPIVDANVRAATDLARQAAADVAAHGGASTELPDWRIVTPPPPGELLAEYRSAESATGVPWQYLAAIHFVETRMGRIRGNSVAGAQGPMQFIPSTWDTYGNGGDINNTHDAIHAAARMLRNNGAPSDMASALYSYNPSNRYVRAVSVYAEQIRTDERAYLGYYHWQVYYGSRLLPEGFGS
ncbi:MAG: GH23 [uncultured Acidimicrobiales bacterium]|uniref:GH23 n=1 Tax=uncultured Acidimicrobiales bacterium TaxID=310071 RepID=A0A6J4H3E7_9ACTN|nr:MAG: GH23 [uncultured Acidimicrobiales bacterium]